ncbi:MAG: hypothetical protein R3F17_13600 [Planctomycetota bacterium]
MRKWPACSPSAKVAPLSTLQSHVEYGTAEAHNTYGKIGVKVWLQ